MNNVSKQQLSALMDGELAADETRFLLRRMERDPALALTWNRYHVLRECLQGQILVQARTDQFCERVLRQTGMPPSHATGRASRWLRVGMGGALAASVAVAALVMVRPAADVSTTATVPSRDRAVAPQIAAVAAPVGVPITNKNHQDFSLLLRQPGASMLNVEPASATRSDGFYGPSSVFNPHVPPQWIVVQQPQVRSNVVTFPSVNAASREVPLMLRQAGNQ